MNTDYGFLMIIDGQVIKEEELSGESGKKIRNKLLYRSLSPCESSRSKNDLNEINDQKNLGNLTTNNKKKLIKVKTEINNNHNDEGFKDLAKNPKRVSGPLKISSKNSTPYWKLAGSEKTMNTALKEYGKINSKKKLDKEELKYSPKLTKIEENIQYVPINPIPNKRNDSYNRLKGSVNSRPQFGAHKKNHEHPRYRTLKNKTNITGNNYINIEKNRNTLPEVEKPQWQKDKPKPFVKERVLPSKPTNRDKEEQKQRVKGYLEEGEELKKIRRECEIEMKKKFDIELKKLVGRVCVTQTHCNQLQTAQVSSLCIIITSSVIPSQDGGVLSRESVKHK